jgi:PAS domain-containing protein
VLHDTDGKLNRQLEKLAQTEDILQNFGMGYKSEKLGERVLSITARGMIVAEEEEEEEELMVIRDITERILQEQEIKRQSEFLNSVLHSLTHPFYVIDANDYTIKLANQAAKLGDLSKNPTCYALTHKSDKPCEGEGNVCPLEEVKKTKKSVILEHIHYDEDGKARYVQVHGYPVLDAEGNVTQMIEYNIDITERKRAEAQIKELQEYLQLQIERMPIGLIVWDTEFRVRSWNPAAEKIFGFTASEARGKHPYDIIVPSNAQPRVDDI